MFDRVKPEAMKQEKPPARRLRLHPIKHYDWIAIVASSWFPLPSQAFFLDIIEESYNMNPPLIIYPNKSGFRSMCCLFSLIFFGWATRGWIRVAGCAVSMILHRFGLSFVLFMFTILLAFQVAYFSKFLHKRSYDSLVFIFMASILSASSFILVFPLCSSSYIMLTT